MPRALSFVSGAMTSTFSAGQKPGSQAKVVSLSERKESLKHDMVGLVAETAPDDSTTERVYGRVRSAFRRLRVNARRWLRDEMGAEVVELALVVPLLVGIVWSSFEFWQLMSLRAAVRTTTAQAARFVTAYAAPPDTIDDAMPVDEACWRLQELVDRSLRFQRGNMGDALNWEIHFFKVIDPNNAHWDGNVQEVTCSELFNRAGGLQANDQFGVKLNVSVPWLEVLFGLTTTSTNQRTVSFSDTAVGATPGMPYGDVRASGRTLSCGPGGGRVEVCWSFDASFVPNLVEVYRGDPETTAPVYIVNNPSQYGGCSAGTITIPVGASTMTVIAYGGDRELIDSVVLTCP